MQIDRQAMQRKQQMSNNESLNQSTPPANHHPP